MINECTYPNCGDCRGDEYCIRSGQKTSKLPPKKKDRRAYYKEYYQKKKVAKKGNYRKNYLKRKYPSIEPGKVDYLELYDSMMKLRKKIGESSFCKVMDAIEQIDKELMK